MTKPKPKEQLLPLMSVKARGKVYATVKEAAKALGVKEMTVRVAQFKGRTDYIGIGSGRAPGCIRKGSDNGRAKSINIGGIDFETLTDVDKYIGKSAGYTSNAIKLGRYERVVFHVTRKQAELLKEEIKARDRRMSYHIEDYHYMGNI